MIKVGVMSDIHGNISALKKVLEQIDNSGIKKLLILGDLAIMGEKPNETVTFIRNLSDKYDIEIIQGNTDLFVVNKGLPDVPDEAKKAIQYAKDTLSQENLKFLKNLPVQKSIRIGQTSILMVHGSPRKNNENIFPGKNIEEIKPMIENVNETLILCGHTHLPAGYQIENKTIVNAGSVGRPFTEDKKSCFVILEIDENENDTFSVEHKFV